MSNFLTRGYDNMYTTPSTVSDRRIVCCNINQKGPNNIYRKMYILCMEQRERMVVDRTRMNAI